MRTALAGLALVLVWAPTTSRSTTIELRPLAQMATEAQTIVHARVLAVAPAYEQDQRIWTTYTLEVIEGLKPDLAAGSRLTIKQVGGTVGEHTLEAVGFPHFQQGDEVVLFLKDFGAGWQSVMNAWQGCLRVTPPQPAAAGKAAVPARVPDAAGLFEDAKSTELAGFKAAVRAALATARKSG